MPSRAFLMTAMLAVAVVRIRRAIPRCLSGHGASATLAVALSLGLGGPARSAEPGADLDTPAATAKWLQERHDQQVAASKQAQVFQDFRYTDRFEASGIRFTQRAVEDAHKRFKAAHYDHGAGLAVADVDGDGRLDLYFVGQLGGSELWRNVGGGKFENITRQAGVGLAERISVAAAFGDIDNDGDPDLFVTTVRSGNVLLENLGRGRFRDISGSAGVGYSGHSSGVVLFDFDRDGLLDVYVCNVGRYTTDTKGVGGYYLALTDAFKGHLHPERSEGSLLYRNLGGRKFKEVAGAMKVQDSGWSGDATFTDLNEDGFPDLYVLNMQGDDHYYENDQGRGFLDRTSVHFPKTPWGAMGAKFFDFNQDGRLDLFVTDMHSDMSDPQIKLSQTSVRSDFEKRRSEEWCTAQWSEEYLQGSSNNVFGNVLYLNEGQGRFADLSLRANAETFWPWGLSVGDLNADGFEDVFVTAGMGYGFRYAINSLLLNEHGQRFRDSEFVLGVEPRQDGRVEKTAYVLDCSGADRNHPRCAGRTGLVRIAEILSSRSSAVLDLDDDGDLDVVTNEMDDRPQVLISDLTDRVAVRYLKVRLVGRRSNRDGLGTKVRVHAGGRTFTQFHDGKSGYLSQSGLPLYFGLGNATQVTQITRVELLWPSGARQVVETNLTLNTTRVIEEP